MSRTSVTRKTRVLVLSHTSDITGGAELSMLDVFDTLSAKYNVEPVFIIREPVKALGNALKKRGWRYHALRYNFWSERDLPKDPYGILKNASINNPAITEIEHIIQKEAPAVVVTNSVISPWASIAAYTQMVPHIWFVREYGDLDHGRDFLLSTEETFETVGSLSDLVVANSLTLQAYLENFISKEKLSTLYTPFQIEKINDKSREIVASPFTVQNSLRLCIVAGSVVESKGQLDIIEAIGQVHKAGYDVELCVVGHTDNKAYYDAIQKVIKKYGIAKYIHFIGFRSNPLPFMALADIGIMTSRMEAFGRVTFEYLALGKAVIGANSGATPEMVRVNENGFLFRAGSSEELAKHIRRYAQDPELAKIHGKASEKIAERMMSQSENIDAFYHRLATILDSNYTTAKGVPVHLIHHWLEYPPLALKLNGAFGYFTKNRLKAAAKDIVRPTYNKVRSLIAHLTGK